MILHSEWHRLLPRVIRCHHPHCRTSLTEHEAVLCPHLQPFCEHCTWEDGCDECAGAA